MIAYLSVWTVVFVAQTVVVRADSPSSIDATYFGVNAAILAGGLGLNLLGSRMRDRRAAHAKNQTNR